jgi:cell division protein FtsQ
VIPRKPIEAGPSERYWRARANRRVRKARMTQRLLRISLVVAVNALFFGAIGFMALRAADRVRESGAFAVREIEIHGVRRASEAGIRAALADVIGRDLLELKLEQVEKAVRRDPWVREASIRRVLPRTLRITVEERSPAALARIRGETWIVDRTGYVVGRAGDGFAEHLPTLTGLGTLAGRELADGLRRGVELIERLNAAAPRFIEAVAELDLSSDDRVLARTREPGPALVLDPERIERNLQEYLAIGGGIENAVGPLHYVDLRWKDRIAVMPAMAVPEDR